MGSLPDTADAIATLLLAGRHGEDVLALVDALVDDGAEPVAQRYRRTPESRWPEQPSSPDVPHAPATVAAPAPAADPSHSMHLLAAEMLWAGWRGRAPEVVDIEAEPGQYSRDGSDDDPEQYAWTRGNQVGTTRRGQPVYRWTSDTPGQRPRDQAVEPDTGRKPAQPGQQPTPRPRQQQPRRQPKEPAAAVEADLRSLNVADLSDDRVQEITGRLLSLSKESLHGMRAGLGIPEKGLKSANRSKLAARLIAHVTGQGQPPGSATEQPGRRTPKPPAAAGAPPNPDAVLADHAAGRLSEQDAINRLASMRMADLRAYAGPRGLKDRKLSGLAAKLLASIRNRPKQEELPLEPKPQPKREPKPEPKPPAPASKPTPGDDAGMARALEPLLKAGNGTASLVDLQKATGLSTPDLHALVQDLRRRRVLYGMGAEGRHGISSAERAVMIDDGNGSGILHIGVRDKDAFKRLLAQSGESQPPAPAAKETPKREPKPPTAPNQANVDRVKAAYAGAARLTDEQLSQAHATIDGMGKPDLDAAAAAMGFQGAGKLSRPKLAEQLKAWITGRRGGSQRSTMTDRPDKPLDFTGGDKEKPTPGDKQESVAGGSESATVKTSPPASADVGAEALRVADEVRSDPAAHPWEKSGKDRLDMLAGMLRRQRPPDAGQLFDALKNYAQERHLGNRVGKAMNAAGRQLLGKLDDAGRQELERIADQESRYGNVPPSVAEYLAKTAPGDKQEPVAAPQPSSPDVPPTAHPAADPAHLKRLSARVATLEQQARAETDPVKRQKAIARWRAWQRHRSEHAAGRVDEQGKLREGQKPRAAGAESGGFSSEEAKRRNVEGGKVKQQLGQSGQRLPRGTVGPYQKRH